MTLGNLFALGALLLAGAQGQTSTKCDPLKETCPQDQALGTSLFETWNSSSPSTLDHDYWTYEAGEEDTHMLDQGLVMTLNKKGDSVTAITSFYIFWGEVEIQFQAAKGQGLISTLNLLSDDLDEIDLEVIGANETHVSTNWYGQGNQTQDNSAWFPINPSAQDAMHTYKITWAADKTEWYFDNQLVRTVPYNAPKLYPQTPSYIKMGLWSAGDSDQPGTVQWAGGATQWNQAPFQMTVKSIKITDGSVNASHYGYSTPSDGGWKSIYIMNGTSDAAKAVNAPPPQTAAQRWHGLSTGAKIGIAGGVIGVAALATIAFVFFFFKQRAAGKKQRIAEEAAWDREHTELMSYQGGGMHKDEFAASSVSVDTTQQRPPRWAQ